MSTIVKMDLADRVIGLLLSRLSLSIITYYTFWVIILVSSLKFNSVIQFLENSLFIFVLKFSAFCW